MRQKGEKMEQNIALVSLGLRSGTDDLQAALDGNTTLKSLVYVYPVRFFFMSLWRNSR